VIFNFKMARQKRLIKVGASGGKQFELMAGLARGEVAHEVTSRGRAAASE
jgi:hypothetical protein